MSVDVFVLSACSGDKEISPPDLDCEEIDESSRTDLLDAYPDTSLPAESLYTGNEHTRVKTVGEGAYYIIGLNQNISRLPT